MKIYLVARRHDRVFLPGWWKLWEQSPQWSPTARRRIGIPEPTPPSDWHLWAAELRQTPPHLNRSAV